MALLATSPPSMPAVGVALRPVRGRQFRVHELVAVVLAGERSRPRPRPKAALELVEKIFTPPVFSSGESRLMLDTVRPVIPAMQLRCSLQVR